MANGMIQMTVVNPADSEQFEVEAPVTSTPAEVLQQLIADAVIPPPPNRLDYILAVKGGHQLPDGQSFESLGLDDGVTLQLIAPTPGAAGSEFRRMRREGDERELRNVRCSIIDWQWLRPACLLEVFYRLPSYVARDVLRHEHRLRIALGPDYPARGLVAYLVDRPFVYHPNVFSSNGRICLGKEWNYEEGLGFLLVRIAKMLLYYDGFTNPGHPANLDAAGWYRAERHRFPLGGDIDFPDPISGLVGRPRIQVMRRR